MERLPKRVYVIMMKQGLNQECTYVCDGYVSTDNSAYSVCDHLLPAFTQFLVFYAQELARWCSTGCSISVSGGHWDDRWCSGWLYRHVPELPHFHHQSLGTLSGWTTAPQLCHPDLLSGAHLHLQSPAGVQESVRVFFSMTRSMVLIYKLRMIIYENAFYPVKWWS